MSKKRVCQVCVWIYALAITVFGGGLIGAIFAQLWGATGSAISVLPCGLWGWLIGYYFLWAELNNCKNRDQTDEPG